MKTVLVSSRLIETADYVEHRQALDLRWGALLAECGILGVPVLHRAHLDDYFDQLRPQGVLLTGGGDLSSVAPHDPLARERDELETALIRRALRDGLPLLGVCRGLQMIAGFYGCDLCRVEGHVRPSHEIETTGEGSLARHYPRRLEVNSYHEYGLKELTPDLRVTARHAGDGSIEAFEHRSDRVAAIMWHPERCEPFAPADLAWIRAFLG